MILKASVVAVGLALGAAPALAQQAASPADAKALGDCMLAHSTPELEQMFKSMLIDALKDDTESLNKDTAVLGVSMLAVAMQSCGVLASELQSPRLGAAAKLYSQAIGIKLMTAAFAKMGH